MAYTNYEYGRIAALRPANTNEQKLYGPSSGEQVIGIIRICNQDGSTRTYSIAHTDSDDAASGEDWIVYQRDILPNDTEELSINLKYPETIRVQVDAADKVSFVLEGLKIS